MGSPCDELPQKGMLHQQIHYKLASSLFPFFVQPRLRGIRGERDWGKCEYVEREIGESLSTWRERLGRV